MKKSKFLKTAASFVGKPHSYISSIVKAYGCPSWYAASSTAWCDLTVSSVLIKIATSNSDSAYMKSMGYPQATINTQKCRKLGIFHYTKDGYTPKAGDLLLFRWNKANDDNFDHIGIAYKDAANGKVTTIEGNASSDQKVHYYSRDLSYVKAVIRIPWEKETSTSTTAVPVTGKLDAATWKGLQTLLKKWGYDVTVSGKKNKATIKAWQSHLSRYPKTGTKYYPYTIDGEAGAKTHLGTKKLLKKAGYYTGTPNEAALNTAAIKALQSYLNNRLK